MPETVTLPAVGRVDERWVIAGVALIVGIVGWAWYQRGSTVPEEELPPETDDFTEAAVDAYQGAFGTPALTTRTPNEPGYLPPTSDAEWAQRAQTILTGVNYDPLTAATAVGKYLTRQNLTPVEADIVRVAIAQLGAPPQGTYPVTVVASQSGGTGGTGGSGGSGATGGSVRWDDWTRQTFDFDPRGTANWGKVARRTLGPDATRDEVYYRSLDLQRLNPEVSRKYMLYVPETVIPTLKLS